MGNVPELIYCAGGHHAFASIAKAAGFTLGAQLPCNVPFSIGFADQDWKKPNRSAYMQALAEHRPRMATVLDWERDEQLPEVLSWAEEAAQYCERVLIIPKVIGGIDQLPRRVGGADVVLAFSVPSTYGGTPLPLWEFTGWPVHLLGGAPQVQMRYALHLNSLAEVVSTDGNMANKMAHYCRFWRAQPSKKGFWVQLSEVGITDFGKDANAEAFRRSCTNIIEAWACTT